MWPLSSLTKSRDGCPSQLWNSCTLVHGFPFPFSVYVYVCRKTRVFEERDVTGEQTNRNHFGGRGRRESASHETARLATVRGWTCKHVSTAGVDLALAQQWCRKTKHRHQSELVRGENRRVGKKVTGINPRVERVFVFACNPNDKTSLPEMLLADSQRLQPSGR